MLLFYCTHGAALAAFLSASLSAQLFFCPECRSSHVCDEPPLPECRSSHVCDGPGEAFVCGEPPLPECRSSQVCDGPGEAFVCGEPPLPEPFMCLASQAGTLLRPSLTAWSWQPPGPGRPGWQPLPPVALISFCSASAAAGGSDLACPTLVGASGSHRSIDLTGGYLGFLSECFCRPGGEPWSWSMTGSTPR